MNRKLAIECDLDGIDSLPISPRGTRTLALRLPGANLRCDLHEVNRLACSFERLRLWVPGLRKVAADHLAAAAQQLADRLNYLMEPLALVELDRLSETVQFRSAPPVKDGSGTRYYELVARPGIFALSRYQRPVGEARSRVAIQVTREAFDRLVRDFASVVSP